MYVYLNQEIFVVNSFKVKFLCTINKDIKILGENRGRRKQICKQPYANLFSYE